MSWRAAILVEWESRLELVQALFVWLTDPLGDGYLHDVTGVRVREVPKFKAF